MSRRNRRSSIDRLPEPVKKAIEREFKAGRLTLDELLAKIRSEYGEQLAAHEIPSRSALGRARKSFDAIAKEHREAMDIARVWAQEIGENPQGDIGGALVQVLRTLAFRGVQDAYAEGLSPKELSVLGLAIQRIETAGQLSFKQRKALRDEARAEAAETAAKIAKKGGLSDKAVDEIRRQILGVAS